MTTWRRTYLPKTGGNFQEPFLSLHDRLNQLFDGWSSEVNAPAAKMVSDFNPLIEVKEDKTNYLVDVELAGIKPEEVELSFSDHVLTIKGKRKVEHDEVSEGKKTHYSERFYGSFMRTIPFAEDIIQEKISADFKHGLLSVSLPKKPTDSPINRKIDIKVS